MTVSSNKPSLNSKDVGKVLEKSKVRKDKIVGSYKDVEHIGLYMRPTGYQGIL